MKFSKELKAGLIAILAIVGFVVLYQFMKGKNLFSSDNVFYAKYDNVAGLEPSSPVSINGLKVGQVDEIIPITDKSGKIHFVIKALIKDEFEFSKKSTLEIFEPSLMSGKQIRVNLQYGGEMAKDGDTLSSGFKDSMLNSISSQVGPVKDQLEVVLKRVDSLMINANAITNAQNQEQIKLLLASLNRTVSSFESTAGQTNKLIANNDPRLQKVLDNANLATISARSAIDDYGQIAQNIDTKQLNQTIDELSQATNGLKNVIAGIQNGEGSLGKLTKDEELYHNLNKTAENLNKLVEDMKQNPKRYLNFSVFGKSSN